MTSLSSLFCVIFFASSNLLLKQFASGREKILLSLRLNRA
ncbi:hypothetical protein TcasGA2_TC031858 [Tribolium castaneum]|uniref:Uncharacterized protein n=1 Tax=Tribolium castaneum TaxID=7070 RepID=A0A139W944_TRICA|nr:hypothetical protein TcasGA2_TC031858 [Tribolium castaneum]